MGLFDLPAPLFSAIDSLAAVLAPPLLRLALWGIIAGWLTMTAYRLFSNQEKIGALKAEQKHKTRAIAEFDGEFAELMPLVRHALGLGLRQLGMALVPALLATLPTLFIVIWVAGEYAYRSPEPGSEVLIRAEPSGSNVQWIAAQPFPLPEQREDGPGWRVTWPPEPQSLLMNVGHETLLELPLTHDVPIIHKKKWWNILMANPLGYLPADGETDVIRIDLPEQSFINAGPGWLRGWMFSFFTAFLLSSLGFKFLLRLH